MRLLKYIPHRRHQMKLVIVESPAKCKKIEEYLGTPYKCMASYGHFRVLNDLGQIDPAKGYRVAYALDPAARKRQQVARLCEAIVQADEVILATDDDREGEAIAWHICDTFGLPVTTTPRAIFHEITEGAVCAAIAAPRTVNMAMVAAAQARQVIDLLVGFKITPLLWRYVCANRENPLSAGRCQTPALRLIYDNDCAARESAEAALAAGTTTTAAYRITGYFTAQVLAFECDHQPTDPTAFLTAQHAAADHRYEGHSTPKTGPHAPPQPFTTSRLQQAAGGSVKETMKLAQTLYEGGHITYMRTDAQTYSHVFIDSARDYIARRWGAEYVGGGGGGSGGVAPVVRRKPKAAATGAPKPPPPQQAHEAIRPTHVEFTPEQARAKLGQREARLYELIWTNTMKSLMLPAQVSTYTAAIVSPKTGARYTRACSRVQFPGWKIVDGAAATAAADSPEWDYLLSILAPGTATPYKTITAAPIFKTPTPHHTEAALVKMLEEMGIGRPSTFAMLVDKIQERDYVQKKNIEPQKVRCFEYTLNSTAAAADAPAGTIIKTAITKEVGGERGKLLLQPIGRIVSDFLNIHFAPILNYEYTCAMEKALDDVAADKVAMAVVCRECDTALEACIAAANAAAVKIRHVFGAARSGAPELVVGRQGAVIKMSAPDRFVPLLAPYSELFDLAMFEKVRRGDLGLDMLIPVAEMGAAGAASAAPLSTASVVDLGEWEGKRIYIKTGRFGPYVSLVSAAAAPAVPAKGKKRATAAAAAADTQTRTLKPLGPRTQLSQYTRDEVIALLEGRVEDPKILRKLGPNLSIRMGPKGSPYIYYKTLDMKKPAFYKLKGFLGGDPVYCEAAILLDWITQKYPATATAAGEDKT